MTDQPTIDLLTAHTKNILNDMGKVWGLTRRYKDRNEQARAVVEQMSQPELVRERVEQLNERQRTLLEMIQMAGGRISTAALRRQALRSNLVEASSAPSPYRSYYAPTYRPQPGSFEAEVIALIQTGLVLSPGEPRYGTQYLDLGPRIELLIPAPVLAALPPLSAVTTSLEGPPPPQVKPGDAGAFQRDLYLYWSYLRDNTVTVTKQGLVSKTHLKRINAELTRSESLDDVRDENSAGRLRFLRALLMNCQLVRLEGTMLTPAPDSEGFFLRPLAERVKTGFATYRQMRAWDELLRIPDLNIRGRRVSDTDAPPFIVMARQIVLRKLADYVGEGWQDAARLRDLFFQRHYEFLLPRQTSSWSGINNPYVDYGNNLGWTFVIPQVWETAQGRFYESDAPLNEEDGWSFVEGGFIDMILREPLHWLGLVDIGEAPIEDDSALAAFRLTAQGAHILLDKPLPEHAEPTGGRLIVQPTFEVLAYPPVQETHLALLDRIAERERLDQVAAYRLTRESIYRARQQHGMSLEEVTAALERESGADLPQNVAYTLQEWGRAQDRVLLRDDLVLLQAEPALLDRLAAHDATLLARRLTPSSALVPPEAQLRVEAALFELDTLPVVYAAPPPPADQQASPTAYLEVEPDGLIRFRPGAPRLYLKRALAPFTVEVGADLRVTTAQVQQAVQHGLPVERIIALLAGWSGGVLPAELEQAIKVWGGFFGSAQVERPLLLRLSDARTLAALQDDPEINALLQPYQPEGVLAQVNPDDLPRLRELFAERGIDLEDPQAGDKKRGQK
jgi:hypothetical protein